jgi:hypothetical protein
MIARCRLCGSPNLRQVLDLGVQAFTGIFPPSVGADIDGGPLVLLKCEGACGLVQLGHNFDLSRLYGDGYGYRSGLNAAMVQHLAAKAGGLNAHLERGDVVCDVGSNDGTFLGFVTPDCDRIGIDPTAAKFAPNYPAGVAIVPEFFSCEAFLHASRGRRAKLVTSIACFYDMPDPLGFARGVASILVDGGLWHTEQSYLPAMLRQGSYDTVCHEHVEYYAMKQLMFVANSAGFTIESAELNDVNGGSVAVTMRKRGTFDHCGESHRLFETECGAMTAYGRSPGMDDARTWDAFAHRVARHRVGLTSMLERFRSEGKTVIGLGASTKGNVILQACGITRELVSCIGEVNPDKFGRVTPGTGIPIVPEDEAFALKPDYALVLPWHFRRGMVERYLPRMRAHHGKLIFPLPEIEVQP